MSKPPDGKPCSRLRPAIFCDKFGKSGPRIRRISFAKNRPLVRLKKCVALAVRKSVRWPRLRLPSVIAITRARIMRARVRVCLGNIGAPDTPSRVPFVAW